jgi:sugar lactone lactonase YvrE
VREWGRKGSAPGEFWIPAGLAFGLEGSLYVSDTGNSRIQHFSAKGDFLREWGSNGAGPSQFGAGWKRGDRFAGPQFITVDHQGRVYTADTSSFRVQRFSQDGKFECQWQNSSSGPGGFGPRSSPIAGPIALCADAQDRLWVGSVNGRVQQFTASGKYLRCLGAETGSAPGQFHIPHGMAFDSQGNFYVADTLNFRIQKFGKL